MRDDFWEGTIWRSGRRISAAELIIHTHSDGPVVRYNYTQPALRTKEDQANLHSIPAYNKHGALVERKKKELPPGPIYEHKNKAEEVLL